MYREVKMGYGEFILQAGTDGGTFTDTVVGAGENYGNRMELVATVQAQPADTTQIAVPNLPAAAAAESTVGAPTPIPAVPTGGGNPVTIIPAPTPLPADALLLGLMSDTSYIDDVGVLHVVGELRNDSNVDAGGISVTVSFYDAGGNFIADTNGKSLVKSLSPGERAPFAAELPPPAGMRNYSIKAVGHPVAVVLRPHTGIVTIHAAEDNIGFYTVSGSIKNMGDAALRQPKVVVSLYNRGGGLINVSFAYLRPRQLAAGKIATFNVPFTYFPGVLNYRLTVVDE